MSWTSLRSRIGSHNLTSTTWRSNQKNLLVLCDDCESMDVNSDNAERCSISNLCTLLKYARRAVENYDLERVDTLFEKGAAMNNIDLRLYVGSARRETVMIEEGQGVTLIAVSPEQFARVSRSTRIKFAYAS